MFKAIISILCLTALSGCALFSPQIDKAAKAAGKLVTFYCDNVPDDSVREQFRTKVNAVAAPNKVVVMCINGKEPLVTDTGLEQ